MNLIQKFFLLFMVVLFPAVDSFAGTIDLPYSGRLVAEDGKPIDGPVDLVVEFFEGEAGGSSLSGPLTFPATVLEDGVFQFNLSLSASEFHKVFSSVDAKVWIQVTDGTNGSVYPRQLLSATPYALKVPVDGSTIGWNDDGELELKDAASVTKIDGQKVVAKGAGNGQVLTWDSSSKSWKPSSVGLNAGEVDEDKLADNATSTAKLQDGAVTPDKVAHSCSPGDSLRINGGGTGFDCYVGGVAGSDITNNGNAFGLPATIGTNDTQPLNLETAGAIALTIDALQDVGVGETSPGSTLDIKGSAAGVLTGTLDTTLGSAAVTGTGTTFDTELTTGDVVQIGSEIHTVQSITNGTSLTLDANAASTQAGVVGTRINHVLSASTSDGTERFRVTNSGAVQVAGSIDLEDADGDGAHYARVKAAPTMAADVTYTLPPAALDGFVLSTDASGSLSWVDPQSSPTFTADSTGSAATVPFTAQGDGAQTANLSEWKRGGTTTTLIDENGRIGVGSANPSAKIAIESNSAATGSTDGILVEQLGAGDAAISFKTPGDQFIVGIDQSDSDKFKISDGSDFGTDRLTIDSTGNVGIGTTSPDELLEVQSGTGAPGTIKIDTTDADNATSDSRLLFAEAGTDKWSIKNDGDASDSLKITEIGATTRMTFLSGGNVGIGPASPEGTLHVNGEAGSQVLIDKYADGGATSLVLRRSKGSIAVPEALTDGLVVGRISFRGHDGSAFSAHRSGIDSIATEDWNGTSNGMSLAFKTTSNGTKSTLERLRIDHNGNVGIGTTAPGLPLAVETDTDAFSGAMITNVSDGTSAGAGITVGAGTANAATGYLGAFPDTYTSSQYANRVVVRSNSNAAGISLLASEASSDIRLLTGGANERVRVTSAGNVGIGTTTPVTGLHVKGAGVSGTGTFEKTGANTGGALTGIDLVTDAKTAGDNSLLGYSALDSADNLTSYSKIKMGIEDPTNGSEDGFISFNTVSNGTYADRMTITAAGNVGIGTTTPEYTLDLESSLVGGTRLELTSTDTGGKRWNIISTGSTNNVGAGHLSIRNETDLTTPMVIQSGGNVGIGTTTPTGSLHVSKISGQNYLNLSNNGSSASDYNIIAFSNDFDGTPNHAVLGTKGDDGGLRLSGKGGTAGINNPDIYLADDGNVGIGTTIPAKKLHVLASTGGESLARMEVTDNVDSMGSGLAIARSRQDSTAPLAALGIAAYFQLEGFTDGTLLNAGRISTKWEVDQIDDTTSRDSEMQLNVMEDGLSKQALHISSNGNIGIGTAVPTLPLHVVGRGIRVQDDALFPRFSWDSSGAAADEGKWQAYAANSGLLTFSALNDAENAEVPWMSVDRGTGTAIDFVSFPSGNVGIGTTSPDRILHVAGPMKIDAAALPGSPATGDLAVDSGDSNTLKWYDGSSWQSAGSGGGGGGISSCPTGFTMIGTAGRRGAFCVDDTARTAATWHNAKKTCHDLTHTEGHAFLCNHNQWYKACEGGLIAGFATGDQWLDDLRTDTGPIHTASDACTDTGYTDQSIAHTYRCCIQ
jgi:hypothetical protein